MIIKDIKNLNALLARFAIYSNNLNDNLNRIPTLLFFFYKRYRLKHFKVFPCVIHFVEFVSTHIATFTLTFVTSQCQFL